MSNNEYQAGGWYPLPDFAEADVVSRAVQAGYLRHLPLGGGHYRIAGRGRRRMTEKLSEVELLERTADPVMTLLNHFFNIWQQRNEEAERMRDMKKVMDKNDYLTETEGGEKL